MMMTITMDEFGFISILWLESCIYGLQMFFGYGCCQERITGMVKNNLNSNKIIEYN